MYTRITPPRRLDTCAAAACTSKSGPLDGRYADLDWPNLAVCMPRRHLVTYQRESFWYAFSLDCMRGLAGLPQFSGCPVRQIDEMIYKQVPGSHMEVACCVAFTGAETTDFDGQGYRHGY